ncbi:MAG TPA: type II secretion system protein GspN [Nitrospiraceae bacterium]|nr:type II secretion system protein GspN [Nitrospiraceae bacterium]
MKIRLPMMRYTAHAGWSLYAVAMVALFLMLTFPYDHLHAKLLSLFSERTGLQVSSERWNMLWPAGIEWSNLSVAAPGLPAVRADQVELRATLGGLLQGQPTFEGSGRLGHGSGGAQGLIKTRLTLGSWSLTGPAQIAGSIEQVNLAQLSVPLVKQGVLRTEFNQRWTDLSNEQAFFAGEGTWQIELAGLALEQVPIGAMTIPALMVSTVSGRLVCASGTCRIHGLKGEGPDGAFSAEGVLIPHQPISSSQLTMTLSVTMAETLRQRLNLTGFSLGTPGMPLKLTVSGPIAHLQVAL